MVPTNAMPRARRRRLNTLSLGLLVVSALLVVFGGWRARTPGTPEPDWAGLRTAMTALRRGADVSACDAVGDGPPRLDCLQYAQSIGVQQLDPAAVRAACDRMTDAHWRQSCLMDALTIDPAQDLVSYVHACEQQVPLYVFHCESHARNRLEGRPREVPLAPEARPDQLVRVFKRLVTDHTDPEKAVIARAFGERLRLFGVAEGACATIDAMLVPYCLQGHRG